MTTPTRDPWTTLHELGFLAGLGSWGLRSRGDWQTRSELLLGYLRGAQQRIDWGQVDSREVIAFAEAELARIKRRWVA